MLCTLISTIAPIDISSIALIFMRLKPEEIRIITSAVLEQDSLARIYLFGSRVDDNARGGDIDILVLSGSLTFEDKLKIKAKIFESMEDQKLDILISSDITDPFVRLSKENGAVSYTHLTLPTNREV